MTEKFAFARAACATIPHKAFPATHWCFSFQVLCFQKYLLDEIVLHFFKNKLDKLFVDHLHLCCVSFIQDSLNCAEQRFRNIGECRKIVLTPQIQGCVPQNLSERKEYYKTWLLSWLWLTQAYKMLSSSSRWKTMRSSLSISCSVKSWIWSSLRLFDEEWKTFLFRSLHNRIL